MDVHTYRASELFAIRRQPVTVGLPSFMDLEFKPRHSLAPCRVGGAGLYAISFRGRLAYVGMYRGLAGDPAGGDVVAMRWAKHLGTLTLRGHRVSIGKRALDRLGGHCLAHAEPIACMLTCSQASPALHKDRGMNTSVNRAGFAARNWATFSQLNPNGDLDEFAFTYVQLSMAALRARDPESVREAVRRAEADARTVLQPICNVETRSVHARVQGTCSDAALRLTRSLSLQLGTV